MFGLPSLPRTLEASLRDASSSRAEVRASALTDLVRHARLSDAARAQAVVVLESALGDDSPAVRAAAAVGLGELCAGDSLPGLLVAVEDTDGHVRQMAINALGEVGDARAAPRLERALRDERPEVRYQAVIAFARTSPDAAAIIRALARALADDDPAIVHIALRVAEERLDAGMPLDGELERDARRVVEGGHPHARLAAAIFLVKAGDETSASLLARVVRGERIGGLAPDVEDEQAAVELAGTLGRRDLVPALERRAFGLARHVRETCSFHARIALAVMGHARARAEIAADLHARSRARVEGAVVSAGRARLTELRAQIAALGPERADGELVREALDRLARGREDR